MTTSNSTEANKALVLAGIKGVFIDRDPSAVDRLFSADYRQHNPQIPNGSARKQRMNVSGDAQDFEAVLLGNARMARPASF